MSPLNEWIWIFDIWLTRVEDMLDCDGNLIYRKDGSIEQKRIPYQYYKEKKILSVGSRVLVFEEPELYNGDIEYESIIHVCDVESVDNSEPLPSYKLKSKSGKYYRKNEPVIVMDMRTLDELVNV